MEQVRDGLKHLYDFPYLERHQRALSDVLSAPRPGETWGQALRREFIAAIEALSPGPSVSFRAPQARLYNLLLLRYVEGLTVHEVARELGLSLRQVHRDLRRGEAGVAALLWARLPDNPAEEEKPLSSVQVEISRLDAYTQPTDIRALLLRAVQAVSRLAELYSVHLKIESPSAPLLISTNPVIARQVLINLLSRAVGRIRAQELRVSLMVKDEIAHLILRYPAPTAGGEPVADPTIALLLRRLEWSVTQEMVPASSAVVTLRMAARCPMVLVIDDNEGLAELLSDYLTGLTCWVTAATNGREGLRLAQESHPAVIILDVMMPEMDGWEILQRLRTNPQTAAIPVIVCSVINNPDLAYSLNAAAFLPKPLRRDALLETLRQLQVL